MSPDYSSLKMLVVNHGRATGPVNLSTHSILSDPIELAALGLLSSTSVIPQSTAVTALDVSLPKRLSTIDPSYERAERNNSHERFQDTPATTLSDTQAPDDDSLRDVADNDPSSKLEELSRARSPPPQYPISEPSGSACPSPRPPPFSSLYTSTAEVVEAYKTAVTEAGASASVPAYAPLAFGSHEPSTSSQDVVAETKAALPQDTKGESSKKDEENEPPPAYSEGSSPLETFNYLMAAAGGAASIITQVQQGGAPPINTLGGNNCETDSKVYNTYVTLQMLARMRILLWTFGMHFQ